jgi:hypothetical protein
MWEFFKDWKRKLGAVSLVMALAVSSLWIRSLMSFEEVQFSYHKRSLVFIGQSGGLIWCGRLAVKSPAKSYRPPNLHWLSFPVSSQWNFESFRMDYDWVWQLSGFGIGLGKIVPTPIDQLVIVVVPFWSIVLPLTLIAERLLLSESRRPKTVVQFMPSPDARSG